MYKYESPRKCDSKIRYFKFKHGLRRKEFRMTAQLLQTKKTPRVQWNGWSSMRMCRTNGRADDLSFVWNVRGPQPNVLASFSNVEMATNANLPEPSDSEQSSLNGHNLSNRSSNKSLRVAEKERRKNEAEDPFTLALKYFSDGKI